MSPRKRPLAERFWEKVSKSEGCWNWTAGLSSSGYGRILGEAGRLVASHRISWAMENGPIPEGMLVDHVCLNRTCVRPSHLRLATQKQNLEHRDGARSKSGVRGVYWRADSTKWEVRVMHNYAQHYGGLFADIKEAEAAAKALRNSLFTHNNLDRKAA